MDKGSDKRGGTRNTGRRWSEGRRKYTCRDSVDVRVPNRAFLRKDWFQFSWGKDPYFPKNGVSYQPEKSNDRMCRPFVSEAEFDKMMSKIVKGPNVKTITFPKTTRTVCERAFNDIPLKSVVLNEGLEVF